MFSNPIAAKYRLLLKVTSIVLMAGAIGLETWTIVVKLNARPMPNRLMPLVWLGSIALFIHVIEGMLAAALAPSRNKQPLQYGFYTFWIGTVGLLELLTADVAAEPEAESSLDGP